MRETMQDTITSVKMRLKNKARQLDKPYDEILQYYGIERLLYRLSKTQYADNFILKGGLVFYVWDLPLRRPTRDIDFRAYLENSRESILNVLQEATKIDIPEDGLFYDLTDLTIEKTQVDANYEGVRANFLGYLGKSKIFIQIDIGFFDEIASNADIVEYPVLLSEFEGAKIRGYPKESVISEKLHAMVVLREINSRMKDYYDIWLILETFEIHYTDLKSAIETTFARRETELPTERPIALQVEFAVTNQARWKAFMSKADINLKDVSDFVSVIEKIWSFLEYPLLFMDGDHNYKTWIPSKGWK